ncbi:hypothetical protein BDV98DRAFT_574651 [Pterulicium gracile]|uniref:Uncharacterized protein n=1 Tax=Pterulicium gracile TaxID=1884261 RepID=A0A5C3Q5F8_9AGAR|nr:hypothetical protein BDV98DRAFT_574651 [Pterula gracilis]
MWLGMRRRGCWRRRWLFREGLIEIRGVSLSIWFLVVPLILLITSCLVSSHLSRRNRVTHMYL